MKKLITLTAALFAVSGILANSANACTVMPVDVEKQVQEMEKFVAPALDIEKADVVAVSAKDASGDYIWTDPMCPEGIKAQATYTVEYNNPSDPLTKGCTGVVKVSKTHPTGFSEIPVKHAYEVEIVQAGVCQE